MDAEKLLALVHLGDEAIESIDRDEARLYSALETLRDVLERKRTILEAQLAAVQEVLTQTKEAMATAEPT